MIIDSFLSIIMISIFEINVIINYVPFFLDTNDIYL